MYSYNKRIYDPKYDTPENKEKLEEILNAFPTPVQSDCPLSWVDEVKELLEAISANHPEVVITQFKQKLGELDVFYGPFKFSVEKLISETREKLKKKGVYA